MNWQLIGQKTQVTVIDNIRYRIDAALKDGKPSWRVKRQCLKTGEWTILGDCGSIVECEGLIQRRHEYATHLDIKC